MENFLTFECFLTLLVGLTAGMALEDIRREYRNAQVRKALEDTEEQRMSAVRNHEIPYLPDQ